MKVTVWIGTVKANFQSEIRKPVYISKGKIPYGDLENSHFKLQSENLMLKKQSNDQEEKLKQ
jgi:hypothetical protein